MLCWGCGHRRWGGRGGSGSSRGQSRGGHLLLRPMTVTSCVGCVQEGPDNSLPPKARDQAGVLSRNEGAICTSKLPKLKKNLGDYHIFSMLKEYKLVLIKKKKCPQWKEGSGGLSAESWLVCGRRRQPGDERRADTLSTLPSPSRKAPLRLPPLTFSVPFSAPAACVTAPAGAARPPPPTPAATGLSLCVCATH